MLPGLAQLSFELRMARRERDAHHPRSQRAQRMRKSSKSPPAGRMHKTVIKRSAQVSPERHKHKLPRLD
ncbi:hypothetical protein VTH06DRAFT_6415 [Thermothelomyces fergusii]